MLTSQSTPQSPSAHLFNSGINSAPRSPRHLDRIDTSFRTLTARGLTIAHTNFPDGVATNPDTVHSFIYNERKKQWAIGGKDVSYLSPFSAGSRIPDRQPPITFFSVTENNWVPTVRLPEKAQDNDVIVFTSSAKKNINLEGIHHPNAAALTIRRDEHYVFRYSASQHQWKIQQSPKPTHTTHPDIHPDTPNKETPTPVDARAIALTGPQTLVSLKGANTPKNLTLPAQANDRDRVVITSTSKNPVNIDSSNINNHSVMQIEAGDRYELMYLKKNQKWEVINAPQRRYAASELKNGKVPALTTPTTVVDIHTKDWKQPIKLPIDQAPGSRIIIRSNSAFPFPVDAGSLKQVIRPGEIIAFKSNKNRAWEKETTTIDLLLLYSDKARIKLGAERMKARLLEGLRLTNEALENSGANFRFRSTDIKEVAAKDHWKKLIQPLSALRDDPTVQGWRNQLKADGIYYEGTENDLGGQGYLKADAYNMVAVGSIDSPTIVMRHELGHNMGISHGGESGSYDQGYSTFKTIMGGNDIPYYSTPHRYTRDGHPLGIENKIDAVRAMNEFSSTVAGYR